MRLPGIVIQIDELEYSLLGLYSGVALVIEGGVFVNHETGIGDADFFPYESAHAARLGDRLYCSGLIPPSDSLFRRSLYQWM